MRCDEKEISLCLSEDVPKKFTFKSRNILAKRPQNLTKLTKKL